MTTKPQAMPYMKLYLSYLTDDDYTDLDRVTRSFYWDFYLLAWNADAKGNIQSRETGEALSIERMAKRLYEDVGKVNTALAKLREAGFLELHENTNTWRVTRYADEQENQEEKRLAWKLAKQSQREDAKLNGKSDNGTGIGTGIGNEKNIISVNQSELELKTPSNVLEDNKRTFTDVTQNDDDGVKDLQDLIDYWVELMPREQITPSMKRIFRDALREGIEPTSIMKKIELTKYNADGNPVGYLIQCIKDLRLIKATPRVVLAIIDDMHLQKLRAERDGTEVTEVNIETLNAELKKSNILPVTIEQVRGWQAEAKAAEEQEHYGEKADNEEQ